MLCGEIDDVQTHLPFDTKCAPEDIFVRGKELDLGAQFAEVSSLKRFSVSG